MSKEDYEIIGKESHKILLYKDGKGKSISARELGPEFMLSGVSRTIRANARAEQDREAIAKSKVAYDTTIAKSFAHHKGSATEFSKYLKSLQPDDIEEISRKIGRDQGVIGVEYVRSRIQADINKNELQLADDRDRLRREGYDVGRNRGNNLII